MQLEDGSTAYIQHTVHMPQSNTILAIQADGTIADLQAEAAALDPETISVLEQYTTKVNARLHLCERVRQLANTSCVTDLCSRFLNFLLLNMFRPVTEGAFFCCPSGGEHREPSGLLQQSGGRQRRPHAGKLYCQEVL